MNSYILSPCTAYSGNTDYGYSSLEKATEIILTCKFVMQF